MAIEDTLKQVQSGEIDATPEIMNQAREYAAQHAVDLDSSGNIHSPQIPFPSLANKPDAEQNKAMYEYINQRDVAYYLDAPLALFGIEHRISRLERTLKTGNYSEPKEDLEHELAAWRFMEAHLTDPEMSYFKEINDQRIAREKQIKERRTTNVTPPQSNKKDLNENMAPSRETSVREVPVAQIETQEKTLLQQVVEDHKIEDWILQNFRSMPPKSVVEAFEMQLKREPGDSNQSQLDVIRYLVDHLNEFPEVEKIVEERKNKI